jgi:conjugal transfer/type IV secretion protein DotA/TraY
MFKLPLRQSPWSFTQSRKFPPAVPLLVTAVVMLLLTLGAAHAQTTPNATSVTWQQLSSANDWSTQIIDNLFPIGNAATGTAGISGEQSAIGTMVGYLNAFVMLFAVAFVAYTTIIEIHRGAETGRVLTERTSSWAPVRMGFAALMMVPVSGGFTVGQAGVLTVAGWGTGMAATVYDGAVSAIGPQGLPIFTPEIPDAKSIVAGIMASELCMALVNAAANETLIPAPTAVTGGDPVNGGYVSYNYALSGNQTGTPTCGSVTVNTAGSAATSEDGVAMTMATDQLNDLNAIISQLRPEVQTVATNYWNDRNSADFTPLWNDLTAATSSYTQMLSSDASSIATSLNSAQGTQGSLDNLTATETQMENLGWAGAGAYFWKIAQINGDNLSYLNATPNTVPPSYDGLGTSLASDLAPVITATNAFSDQIMANATTTDSTQPPTGINESGPSEGIISDILGKWDLNQVLLNSIVSAISPTDEFWQDPFVVLIHLGDLMIGAAEAPIIGISALNLTNANNIWAKLGSSVTPAGVAASFANAVLGGSTMLGKLIFLICMALLIPGLILAFVMPMIPLTMWLAGVASWFILVIEAVIAVPLWMLAHMTYQGEGFHGRGIYGYSLLFNVIFRPVLMLFGLMLGYWLFTIMSWLTFETFSLAGDFVLQQGYILTNLFGIIILVCMLVVLEMAWAVMAFKLIAQIPYQVIQWVGMKPASRVDMENFALSTTTQGSKAVLNAVEEGYRGIVTEAAAGRIGYGGPGDGGGSGYDPPRLTGPGGGGNGPRFGSGGSGAAPPTDSALTAATDVIPPASDL